MTDFNDDDVFVNIVNNNAALKEKIAREEDEIKKDIGYDVKRIMEQSISEAYWTDIETKRKKQTTFRRTLKAAVAVILIIFVIKLGIIINKNNAFNEYIGESISQIGEDLLSNGLAYTDGGELVVLNNSTQKYKNLNIKNNTDIYLYMNILNEEQFNNFIKSVSYVDNNKNSSTYGQTCYYTSFEQFLSINGYPDSETFKNYMEQELKKMYEQSDAQFKENSLITNSLRSKGGK